jgi:hypothetical protein
MSAYRNDCARETWRGVSTLFKPHTPTIEWSIHEHMPRDTVKEALEEALKGFLTWYVLENVEETLLEPVDDW